MKLPSEPLRWYTLVSKNKCAVPAPEFGPWSTLEAVKVELARFRKVYRFKAAGYLDENSTFIVGPYGSHKDASADRGKV